ncbi:MAG: cobalt ECF transporter T component CbiQ [Thiotrichaceae bacterium]
MYSVFTEGNSFVHRRDPRANVMIVLLFTAILSVTSHLVTLGLGWGLALIMVGLARLPLLPLLQRMIAINLFNFLLFLVLPLTVTGETYWKFGYLTISTVGVHQAIVIGVKTNAILLWLTALLSTIETITLAHVLHRCHLPDKLILLLLFTLRYIEVLYQEYLRLGQAMKIRGFVPRANRHTYRSFAYLIGMLLVKSLDRSERIMLAMKCRGFQGKFFLFHQFTWKNSDTGFILIMFSCGFGLIWITWLLP